MTGTFTSRTGRDGVRSAATRRVVAVAKFRNAPNPKDPACRPLLAVTSSSGRLLTVRCPCRWRAPAGSTRARRRERRSPACRAPASRRRRRRPRRARSPPSTSSTRGWWTASSAPCAPRTPWTARARRAPARARPRPPEGHCPWVWRAAAPWLCRRRRRSPWPSRRGGPARAPPARTRARSC